MRDVFMKVMRESNGLTESLDPYATVFIRKLKSDRGNNEIGNRLKKKYSDSYFHMIKNYRAPNDTWFSSWGNHEFLKRGW